MTLIEVLRTARDGKWRWASDATYDRQGREIWDMLEAKGIIVFYDPFYGLSRFGLRMLQTLEDAEALAE